MKENSIESGCQIKGDGILFNVKEVEKHKFQLISLSSEMMQIKLKQECTISDSVHTKFALNGGLFQIQFEADARIGKVPGNDGEAVLIFENMPEEEKRYLEEVLSNTCESMQAFKQKEKH